MNDQTEQKIEASSSPDQPRPSQEAMEEAENIVKARFFGYGSMEKELANRIALALDHAKAEGAERVVRAVEEAGVCETDDYNDFVVVCKDCSHNGCGEDRSIAKEICVAAARQSLAEVKGEKVC